MSVVEIVDHKEAKRFVEEVDVEDDGGEVNRIGNVIVVRLEVLIGLKVKRLGKVILLVPDVEIVVNNNMVDCAVVDVMTVGLLVVLDASLSLICVEVSVIVKVGTILGVEAGVSVIGG